MDQFDAHYRFISFPHPFPHHYSAFIPSVFQLAFTHMCLCLSACLSIRLFACLPLCLALSALCICLTQSALLSMFFYDFDYLPFHLSVNLTVSRSFFLSPSLSLYVHIDFSRCYHFKLEITRICKDSCMDKR